MTLNWGRDSYEQYWDEGVAMGAGSEATAAAFPTLINLDLLKGTRRRVGRPRKEVTARKRSDAADEMGPDEVSRMRREIATEVVVEMLRDAVKTVDDRDLGAGELLRLLADKIGDRS